MDAFNPSPSSRSRQSDYKDRLIKDLPFIRNTITHHNCLKPRQQQTLSACWKINKIKNTIFSPTTQTPIWNSPYITANKLP